jgi:hypothetical protein
MNLRDANRQVQDLALRAFQTDPDVLGRHLSLEWPIGLRLSLCTREGVVFFVLTCCRPIALIEQRLGSGSAMGPAGFVLLNTLALIRVTPTLPTLATTACSSLSRGTGHGHAAAPGPNSGKRAPPR